MRKREQTEAGDRSKAAGDGKAGGNCNRLDAMTDLQTVSVTQVIEKQVGTSQIPQPTPRDPVCWATFRHDICH